MRIVNEIPFCIEQQENRNSQGEDPRTFEENSQGGDLSTLQTNSQGEDPRTFEEPVERFKRSGRKRSGRKKVKKENKIKVRYRRRSWWKKCKERIASFFTAKEKEEEVEKKGRKSDRRPRARQVW